MKIAEALRTSWLEIASHKVRSALTCVAVSIGVAAMVYTFSQIAGMNERVRKGFELIGPGRLLVSAKWGGYVSRGLSRGLTWQDGEQIRRIMPELYMVSPVASRGGVRMKFENVKNDDVSVKGITPEWRRREWVYALRGRFISEEDQRAAARVCVVLQPGVWIKKPFWARFSQEPPLAAVFRHKDLLGRQIMLDDHLFTVVGILIEPPKDRDPRLFHMEFSRPGSGTVFVPLSTFRHCLATARGRRNPDQIDSLNVDTGAAASAGSYKRRINDLLMNLHRGEPDFELRDFREIFEGAMSRIREYAIAIAVIGIVAILAGGIGIMNVTLATIFSRVREIGIRRALGATRRDIIAQFLVEATLLGLLGGTAGAGLGIAAVAYLAPRTDRMAHISAAHVLAAMALAAATAFFFALYPAYLAAKLDPIEALHYE